MTQQRPFQAHDGAARLADFVRAEVAQSALDGGPGFVVSVRRGEQLAMNFCFGQAQIAPGRPLTPETRLPIASLSKQFTAACALVLAERGLISLDAPLGCFLPELSSAQRTPSVRQILDHTSGLRCVYDLLGFSGYEAPLPHDFVWREASSLSSVNAPPQTCRAYANSPYDLIAVAIERVTGAPFDSVLREAVLAPLELNTIALIEPDKPDAPDLSRVYTSLFGVLRETDMHRGGAGSGGLWASLNDMAAWTHALAAEDSRLPLRVWRGLKHPSPQQRGFEGYGLGLGLQTWRGLELIFHGGSLPGVSAVQMLAPSEEVEIVILANFETALDPLARSIIAQILSENALSPDPPRPAASTYRGLIGAVFVSEHVVFGFEETDGFLTLRWQGLGGIPLYLTEGGALRYDGATGPLQLQPDRNGVSVRATFGGETHEAIRAERSDPSSRLGFVGRYCNQECGVEVEIMSQSETLTAVLRGRYGEVRAEAHLIAPGVLDICGAHTRFVLRVNGANALRMDSARTRNLTFVRH